MKKLLLMCCLFTAIMANAQLPDVEIEKGPFTADMKSLSNWQCPDWFRDAKFGIWAHWGPQCQAEDGDWYARGMYEKNNGQYKYHVEHFGDPAVYGLKELCRDWKAEEWNPEELVKLYKEAGAKYFFTLGQHHDNFDLWDSPYQEWNSVNIGPKKNIVKGWADACKKYGLPLGISMHGSHTWMWLEVAQDFDGNLTKADGKGQWWDGYDPQELYAQRHEREAAGGWHWDWDGTSKPDQKYMMKLQNRVLQCVNEFNPDMVYFDDTVLPFWQFNPQWGMNFLQHYYNHSAAQHNGKQQVVVMGKILNDEQKQVMLWDVERGAPDRGQDLPWQTCTCIGSWHYDRNVYNNGWYKSAGTVIRMLVDIVSKNGNLLLSVPIRANGTIDEKEREIVMGIKAWMDINGESIYGTRPWTIFGEGPIAEGSNPMNAQGFNEGQKFSNKDVRYVQKKGKIYATIMDWPEAGDFTMKAFANGKDTCPGKVKKVTLLGYGKVNFKQDANGLTITVPATHPNEIAPAFKIEVKR